MLKETYTLVKLVVWKQQKEEEKTQPEKQVRNLGGSRKLIAYQ